MSRNRIAREEWLELLSATGKRQVRVLRMLADAEPWCETAEQVALISHTRESALAILADLEVLCRIDPVRLSAGDRFRFEFRYSDLNGRIDDRLPEGGTGFLRRERRPVGGTGH